MFIADILYHTCSYCYFLVISVELLDYQTTWTGLCSSCGQALRRLPPVCSLSLRTLHSFQCEPLCKLVGSLSISRTSRAKPW